MRNLPQVMAGPTSSHLISYIGLIEFLFVCCLIFQVLSLVFIWGLLLNNDVFVEEKKKWTLKVEVLRAQSCAPAEISKCSVSWADSQMWLRGDVTWGVLKQHWCLDHTSWDYDLISLGYITGTGGFQSSWCSNMGAGWRTSDVENLNISGIYLMQVSADSGHM